MLVFRITGFQGARRWLETHAVPVHDYEGKTVRLLSITRDITERKRAENALVDRARMLLSTYENMAELIRIGAYKKGSDPAIDDAILYYPQLEEFLKQSKGERSDLASSYAALAEILGMPVPG